MRRTFQITFLWFFAVTAGIGWAGMEAGALTSNDVMLVSAE